MAKKPKDGPGVFHIKGGGDFHLKHVAFVGLHPLKIEGGGVTFTENVTVHKEPQMAQLAERPQSVSETNPNEHSQDRQSE